MAVKFVFLILPHVHLMDLAGPDQTIHEAIGFGADFKVEYCGLGHKLVSSSGLKFSNQKHFSKVKFKPGDYLIIPGTRLDYLLSPAFKRLTSLNNWIKNCHKQQVNLVSICAGAFVLAQSGLLDGKMCTTHFKQTQQLRKLYPRVEVKENILFVEDGRIYSSAGIASGIDLMLHIVEKLKGSYFSHQVARELVIYNRREGSDDQISAFLKYRNHIHSGIHKVQDFTIEHIDQKHSLGELADVAGMSERNFSRVFKRETGITVVSYINSLRKELISNYLKDKDLSYIQIADKIGLESEKQVRRILAGS